MHVVIDTSVFIQRALSPKGRAAQIFQQAEKGEFTLLVSSPILAEYEAVLGYSRIQKRYPLAPENIATIIEQIRNGAVLVEPTERLHVVKDDAKDDMFFECAVAGNAQYIVSDDDHLLNVAEYQGIIVLPSNAFLSFFGDY